MVSESRISKAQPAREKRPRLATEEHCAAAHADNELATDGGSSAYTEPMAAPILDGRSEPGSSAHAAAAEPTATMAETTSVIFLDVDGVLHPFASLDHFSRPCMAALATIVASSGASIVLSSSWQATPAMISLVDEALQRHGMPVCVDRTAPPGRAPSSSVAGRCTEIRRWLAAHPEVESWVALDDLPLDALGERFVLVDGDVGLTASDAAEALRQLLSGGSLYPGLS